MGISKKSITPRLLADLHADALGLPLADEGHFDRVADGVVAFQQNLQALDAGYGVVVDGGDDVAADEDPLVAQDDLLLRPPPPTLNRVTYLTKSVVRL